MQLVIVRIEEALKIIVEKLSRHLDRSFSQVARDLALVGIEVQQSGGVEIVGPIGMSRPLAKLSFGGTKQSRLSIWIDEDLEQQLQSTFGGTVRGAFREAVRLGILMLKPEVIEIRGPFGSIRPFAHVTFPELSEPGKQALQRLK
jgi:hypothetical protein